MDPTIIIHRAFWPPFENLVRSKRPNAISVFLSDLALYTEETRFYTILFLRFACINNFYLYTSIYLFVSVECILFVFFIDFLTLIPQSSFQIQSVTNTDCYRITHTATNFSTGKKYNLLLLPPRMETVLNKNRSVCCSDAHWQWTKNTRIQMKFRKKRTTKWRTEQERRRWRKKRTIKNRH